MKGYIILIVAICLAGCATNKNVNPARQTQERDTRIDCGHTKYDQAAIYTAKRDRRSQRALGSGDKLLSNQYGCK